MTYCASILFYLLISFINVILSENATTTKPSFIKAIRIGGDANIDLSIEARKVTILSESEIMKSIKDKVLSIVALSSRPGKCSGKCKTLIPLRVNNALLVDIASSGNVTVDAYDGSSNKYIVRKVGTGEASTTFHEVQSLEVAVESPGKLEIRGYVKGAKITVTKNGGDFDGYYLSGGSATVENQSSAEIRLGEWGSLVATSNGSGDILYRGDPSILKSAKGSGVIKRM